MPSLWQPSGAQRVLHLCQPRKQLFDLCTQGLRLRPQWLKHRMMMGRAPKMEKKPAETIRAFFVPVVLDKK